jgi:Flp pilus assembly pilin Flp
MKRKLAALGTLFARVAREEQGGECVEYAMTLGFLAVACYVAIECVGVKFFDFWHRMDRALAMIG